MPIYERRLSFLPDWFPFQLRRLKKGDWVYRDNWEVVVISPFTVKAQLKSPQDRRFRAITPEKIFSAEETNQNLDFLLYKKG